MIREPSTRSAEEPAITQAAHLVRPAALSEPRQAQAAFQRGVALHARGMPGQALKAFRAAVELAPDNAEYLRQLAALLTSQGLPEALSAWRRLACLRPGAAALAGLASTLLDQGQPAEALDLLSGGAQQHVDATLVHLTGLALLELGFRKPALGAFYHALSLAPGVAATHAALARALLADGQSAGAASHAQTAFEIAPGPAYAATFTCALIEQGRLAEALAVADQAAASNQASVELPINRSIALEGLGRAQEAVAAARAGLLMGRSVVGELHLATLLLGQGQLTAEAWDLHEARLDLRGAQRWPDRALQWEGQEIRGKTVLLHAEQGLGDTLQFVRYVPLVAARGAAVVLVVPPTLKRLLANTPGAALLLAIGETLPAFDLFAPLLSLPRIFGTTLATIPPPLPYGLAASPPRPDGPLRVGLAWAGSDTFIEARKRSLPAELLWQLRSIPGIALFSLQLDPDTLPDDVGDLVAGVTDMADTAAAIIALDLVITVDTSVAHLAATMGKPVWLLSRFRGCWRWLQHRADSPWYPTVTIHRQPSPGDWGAVLGQVRMDLEKLSRQRQRDGLPP